jgi:oligopeptide transport system permease protein
MNMTGFKASIIILFSMICMSLITTHHDATLCHFNHPNMSPSFQFLFGTDDLGRDIFHRCFYALKISLLVGLLATLIDMIFGSIFGMLAALSPPPVSQLMTRFLDIMTILPQMLLSILVLMLFSHGMTSLIIAISLTGWLPTARAMRLEILKIKKADFVKSLKGFGFSSKDIIFKHLLPSCISTLIVSSALCLPQAIFSEAFMSFLGLGVNPPTPSLGNMIADGLGALRYYPWRLLFPASFVFILIMILHGFIDSLKKRMRSYS